MPKATWGQIEGSPFEDDLEYIPIYDGEMPPKGLYRLRLKMLRLKDNANGDKMLNGLVIVNEPSGSSKVQYNGYDTWFNLNITKQGARWVNNFLSALVPEDKVAALRKAFWGQKVMIDKNDPPNILSIGGVKMPESGADILVSAQLAYDSYGEGAMKPKRFLRPDNLTPNEDDGYATIEDANDEEWYDGTEAAEDDGEADEEYDARAEELEGMERKELLAEAKKSGVFVTRGMKSDAIIDLILLEEFPEDGDEEAEEEDEEPEDEEIAEDEEPEEEPEEDPEPPKRTRRARAAAPKQEPKKAPATRTRRTAAKEEAPARVRTGTRRRKAGSGEPPF